jgi:hypothetical protein
VLKGRQQQHRTNTQDGDGASDEYQARAECIKKALEKTGLPLSGSAARYFLMQPLARAGGEFHGRAGLVSPFFSEGAQDFF